MPLPSLPSPIEDWEAFRALGREQLEAFTAQVMQSPPTTIRSTRLEIPVEGGSILLVIHRPTDAPGRLPGHLYFHGGGWTSGDADSGATTTFCAERAALAHCVVVAVDYRKAPEHPFPTPLDDCLAALRWVVDHAEEEGIDTARLSVGGASAGANLAAALCLRARDEGGPEIGLQLLEVPGLDLTLSQPAHSNPELGNDYSLSRADTELVASLYLAGVDARHPYISPLLAEDLTGLPPAHLMSAEFDLLRDDAVTYAERLQAAGVPAVHTRGLGHVHVSPGFTAVMQSAREWRDEVIARLVQFHGDDR